VSEDEGPFVGVSEGDSVGKSAVVGVEVRSCCCSVEESLFSVKATEEVVGVSL